MTRKPKAGIKRTVPPPITDAATFRRALHSLGPVRKGLNTHRSRIPEERIIGILQEVAVNAAYLAAFAPAPFPEAYEDIKPRRPIAPAGARADLLWNAGVLGLFREELSQFVEKRDSFYAYLSGGQYDSAAEALDNIQLTLGVSSWLMFSRLLLIQLSKGTSAQKDFLDSVIDRPNINVFFAYLAFYYSFGLEDHVSVPELNRELESLSEQGAGGDVVAYFRYHASPAGLSSVDDPYVCVTLEENSPIVDRFETFVEMSQLIFIRSEDPAERDVLRAALEQVRGISDLRVENLNSLINDEIATSQDADFIAACEAYTQGDHHTTASLVRYALSRTSASAWWFELGARLELERASGDEGPPLSERIVSEFRSFLTLNSESRTPETDLQKLALLARKQPAAVCIAAFLDRKSDLTVGGGFTESQVIWALSSPLANPKHLRLLKEVDPRSVAKIVAATAPAAPIATALHDSALEDASIALAKIDLLPLPAARRHMYQGHAFFNDGRFDEAAAAYRAAMGTDAASRFDIIRSLYQALALGGDLGGACELFVEQYFLNRQSLMAFPLVELARSAVSIAGINAQAITRSIVLNVALERGGGVVSGEVSDAYEDVLDFHGCITPSELILADHGIAHDRFCYFLAEVCTIETMEDGTVFDVYDDVEAERVSILQWLIHNDPVSRKIYSGEIAAIVKDQEVAALEVHLDRSRLYVDEAGVRRQIDSESREAFTRYKQLLGEPALELRVEGIEQRLRKLLRNADVDIAGLHLPSTEKEGLFRTLYAVSLDAFALSPTHGFQIYLSTRVLHGSLEGELRNSFASRSLLLSDDADLARQECRALWGDRLAQDEAGLKDLFKILSRFSERTTERVRDLKAKYVRVSTVETPDGLFAFQADPETLSRLRANITVDTTYDELQRQFFDHFWVLVEEALPSVKARIDAVRDHVIGYVENAIRGIKANPQLAPTELADLFTHAMTDFIANCDRAKSWFSRSGVLSAAPFDLTSAARLAAKIVNKCHPAFPIEPVVCVEDGLIQGVYLNASVDLLANCFSNVVQHSGVDGRPPTIEVTAARRDGRFDLVVKGELDKAASVPNVKMAIAERLDNDTDGAGAMVEGGSGLRKMRRIVMHDYGFGEGLTVEIDDDRMVVVACPVPRTETAQ